MNADRSSRGFSLARIHPGEWLAALFGLVLVGALLLPWNGGESAFESPGLLDVLLLFLAALAILLPLAVASSSRTNVPIVYETFLWTYSLLVILVLLVNLVLPPDGGFESGFWLAAGSAVAMSIALWRSVARES